MVSVSMSPNFSGPRRSSDSSINVIDGGTIGLSLLPEIEDADAIIVVDASEIGERPGTMRIFRNREIDHLLSGKRRTVHEVALADLFAAAEIRGRSPGQRVLIAIQPASTELGLDPTPEVKSLHTAGLRSNQFAHAQLVA